jgi:hypothetical protein
MEGAGVERSSSETISFLVDAGMPRSTMETLEEAGFAVQDVRDVGLGGARRRDRGTGSP